MELPRDNGAEFAYELTLLLFDLGENITRIDYAMDKGFWTRTPVEKAE